MWKREFNRIATATRVDEEIHSSGEFNQDGALAQLCTAGRYDSAICLISIRRASRSCSISLGPIYFR